MPDYFELCASMRFNRQVTIQGHTGIVRAIEMEDGSGNFYNVRLFVAGASLSTVTVFVRLK